MLKRAVLACKIIPCVYIGSVSLTYAIRSYYSIKHSISERRANVKLYGIVEPNDQRFIEECIVVLNSHERNSLTNFLHSINEPFQWRYWLAYCIILKIFPNDDKYSKEINTEQ